MTEPKHGDHRNWRMEKDKPIVSEFIGEATGAFTVSTCSESSVVDQFCAHCKQWIVCRGVMGGLRFMGFHDKAQCDQDVKQEIAP